MLRWHCPVGCSKFEQEPQHEGPLTDTTFQPYYRLLAAIFSDEVNHVDNDATKICR